MPLTIEIEQEEDGRWIAVVPQLPGTMKYGQSRAEAVQRVQALALRVIADRVEHGEAVPKIWKSQLRSSVTENANHGAQTMFNEETASSAALKKGRAFICQTSAALYASPSPDAEVIARLAEGTPVDAVAESAETHAAWLPVQTSAGQSGFIRVNTQLTTREELLHKRTAIQNSGKMGHVQMVIGSILCLCGIAATIGTYLMSEKYKMTNPIFVCYGAVVVGGGQFLWGLEQTASSRHTLKRFDALWQQALA